jgi:hypothetical protein
MARGAQLLGKCSVNGRKERHNYGASVVQTAGGFVGKQRKKREKCRFSENVVYLHGEIGKKRSSLHQRDMAKTDET